LGFGDSTRPLEHDPIAMDLRRTATVVHAHRTAQPRDLFHFFSIAVKEILFGAVVVRANQNIGMLEISPDANVRLRRNKQPR
jgi:hypothetical protein